MDARVVKQDARGAPKVMTPKLQRALVEFAAMRPDIEPPAARHAHRSNAGPPWCTRRPRTRSQPAPAAPGSGRSPSRSRAQPATAARHGGESCAAAPAATAARTRPAPRSRGAGRTAAEPRQQAESLRKSIACMRHCAAVPSRCTCSGWCR